MATIRTKTGQLSFARYQLRRAILESVLENRYTHDDRDDALQFFGGCAFCGADHPSRHDHLVAVNNNGDFIRNNVVPACAKCDDSKGDEDFRTWMRWATSPGSLKARGFTDQQIVARISKIEQWQQGYRPKTDEELFGPHLQIYRDILSRMEALVRDAQQLVHRVKPSRAASSQTARAGSTAFVCAVDIRQHILQEYFDPADARGDRQVTVRSGDVRQALNLKSNENRRVCSAMNSRRLLELGRAQVLATSGSDGANYVVTYGLLSAPPTS